MAVRGFSYGVGKFRIRKSDRDDPKRDLARIQAARAQIELQRELAASSPRRRRGRRLPNLSPSCTPPCSGRARRRRPPARRVWRAPSQSRRRHRRAETLRRKRAGSFRRERCEAAATGCRSGLAGARPSRGARRLCYRIAWRNFPRRRGTCGTLVRTRSARRLTRRCHGWKGLRFTLPACC